MTLLGAAGGQSVRRAVEAAARLRGRPRALGLALLGALLLTGAAFLRSSAADGALSATVARGTLTVRLTETGTLRPAESITYRSPLGGREAEIVSLVAEGMGVSEGDLLVRLDTTDLKRELERAVQEARQAEVELQVAEVELQEGRDTVESLKEGEGALGVEEARSGLRLAEKKAERLRDEHEKLKPLMEKGFITRDELDRAAFEAEQAESDLQLARRKADVYIRRTHPQGEQRAQLQLAQKQAALENARARAREARARVRALQESIEGCGIHARRAGLVVYEEFLGANPRRKVRVGDRVTQSQGLVTIPEVKRMMVEASVNEADVHRVQPGQPATITLDAFPGLRLAGRVVRVGTLARGSADRALDEKRFDLVVEIDPTGADLRPEMTARVDILVGERGRVLLVPVNAVFEHQGVPVCHVLRPFRVETRQVDLGESNGLYAEVLAGLREGERVALTDVASGPGVRPAAGSESGSLMNRLRGGSESTPLGPH